MLWYIVLTMNIHRIPRYRESEWYLPENHRCSEWSHMMDRYTTDRLCVDVAYVSHDMRLNHACMGCHSAYPFSYATLLLLPHSIHCASSRILANSRINVSWGYHHLQWTSDYMFNITYLLNGAIAPFIICLLFASLCDLIACGMTHICFPLLN